MTDNANQSPRDEIIMRANAMLHRQLANADAKYKQWIIIYNKTKAERDALQAQVVELRRLYDEAKTTLLPEPEPPPMSAPDALHRLDVMLSCMEHWGSTRRGQTADLMRGWGRWLRAIRPHVEAAAARSNHP